MDRRYVEVSVDFTDLPAESAQWWQYLSLSSELVPVLAGALEVTTTWLPDERL